MDLGQLNAQLNDSLNRFFQQAQEYFTSLDRNELYGWIGVAVGVILVIVGIILL